MDKKTCRFDDDIESMKYNDMCVGTIDLGNQIRSGAVPGSVVDVLSIRALAHLGSQASISLVLSHMGTR